MAETSSNAGLGEDRVVRVRGGGPLPANILRLPPPLLAPG